MTCKTIVGGIVCINPWARFHVGNRYIWMEYHPYGGPTFFTDQACTRIYEPKINDPVWPVFTKWYDLNIAKKGQK